jgi:hypothetical protein
MLSSANLISGRPTDSKAFSMREQDDVRSQQNDAIFLTEFDTLYVDTCYSRQFSFRSLTRNTTQRLTLWPQQREMRSCHLLAVSSVYLGDHFVFHSRNESTPTTIQKALAFIA